MFEDLKNLVNSHNIQKIKTNQRLFNCESSYQSEEESQLSLQDQISQRVHNFHIITNIEHHKSRKSSQMEQLREGLKRYRKECELLEEKIKINEQVHERQLKYQAQKYKEQINCLKQQIEKYEHTLRKTQKEQGIILSLKRQSRQILQLHQQSKRIIERLNKQVASLRRQSMQLKMVLRKKEQEQTELKANKYIESQQQTKLKQQVLGLEQQLKSAQQRKKQLQSIIQRLKAQNQDLSRQIDRSKHQFDHRVAELTQKCRKEVSKLQEDNSELKRRNQLIEDSFIGHLTQTSLNLQHNIKALPERTLRENSTMYLQESPIRAKSKGRERSNTLMIQDPQARNTQNCQCGNKINKLRSKLQQANTKIVELLKQKCNSMQTYNK